MDRVGLVLSSEKKKVHVNEGGVVEALVPEQKKSEYGQLRLGPLVEHLTLEERRL